MNLSQRPYCRGDGRSASPKSIWVVDLQRETARRLTPARRDHNLNSAWSRDGTRLLFSRANQTGGARYVVGWPEGEAFEPTPGAYWDAQGINDGLLVGKRDNPGRTGPDLVVSDLSGEIDTVFVGTVANETRPAVFPDGEWVAFTSDATGVEEI